MVERLENNEFVLLMYLAGELPAEDRADVDRMLATDGALRGQLQTLREAYDGVYQAMARLDEKSPAPGEAAALRRIGRSIRQHMAERVAPPPAPVKRGLPYPWWAYPTAAVAASFLAFITWWGNIRSPNMNLPPLIQPARPPEVAVTPEPHDEAQEFIEAFRVAVPSVHAHDNDTANRGGLEAAERELVAISNDGNDSFWDGGSDSHD